MINILTSSFFWKKIVTLIKIWCQYIKQKIKKLRYIQRINYKHRDRVEVKTNILTEKKNKQF